jgi:hypothetical protein
MITSHQAPNPTNGKIQAEKKRVKWRKWILEEEATLLQIKNNGWGAASAVKQAKSRANTW